MKFFVWFFFFVLFVIASLVAAHLIGAKAWQLALFGVVCQMIERAEYIISKQV